MPKPGSSLAGKGAAGSGPHAGAGVLERLLALGAAYVSWSLLSVPLSYVVVIAVELAMALHFRRGGSSLIASIDRREAEYGLPPGKIRRMYPRFVLGTLVVMMCVLVGTVAAYGHSFLTLLVAQLAAVCVGLLTQYKIAVIR